MDADTRQFNEVVRSVHADAIELERLKDFVRDCWINWDCDTGANGQHPTYCRACRAKALLGLSDGLETQ